MMRVIQTKRMEYEITVSDDKSESESSSGTQTEPSSRDIIVDENSSVAKIFDQRPEKKIPV